MERQPGLGQRELSSCGLLWYQVISKPHQHMQGICKATAQPAQGTAFWVSVETSEPGGSDSKESACNAGDPSSIPGLERSPREGNG